MTLFGQSSGGSTVATILTIPDKFITYKGHRLFTSAIIQSGGFNSWSTLPMKVAQQQYADVMQFLNCTVNDVDCLIAVSATKLQQAFGAAAPWDVPPCRDGCQIAPAADDKIVIEMTGEMVAKAREIPTL